MIYWYFYCHFIFLFFKDYSLWIQFNSLSCSLPIILSQERNTVYSKVFVNIRVVMFVYQSKNSQSCLQLINNSSSAFGQVSESTLLTILDIGQGKIFQVYPCSHFNWLKYQNMRNELPSSLLWFLKNIVVEMITWKVYTCNVSYNVV